MLKSMNKEEFHDKHIDYALGIVYFLQEKYKRSKKHLEAAFNKSSILKQKKHIEELLRAIPDNTG